MRKVFTILLLSIIFSVIIKFNYIQGKSLTVSQMMTSALSSVGADLFSSSFDFSGKLESVLSEEDMKRVIDNAISELGIKFDSIERNKNYSDTDKQIIVEGKDGDGNEVSIKGEFAIKTASKGESLLIISFYNDKFTDFEEINKKVKKIYSLYKSIPEVNTCIIGTIEKSLSDFNCARLENKIFGICNVQPVMAKKNGSKDVYLPFINKSIMIDRKIEDLNVTCRYSKEDKRTYIWIKTKNVQGVE